MSNTVGFRAAVWSARVLGQLSGVLEFLDSCLELSTKFAFWVLFVCVNCKHKCPCSCPERLMDEIHVRQVILAEDLGESSAPLVGISVHRTFPVGPPQTQLQTWTIFGFPKGVCLGGRVPLQG